MRCGQTSVRFACCVLMQIKPGFTTLPREQLPHSTRWQISFAIPTTQRSNSISRPERGRCLSVREHPSVQPYRSERPWSTLLRLLMPPVSVTPCILADCARCIAGPTTFCSWPVIFADWLAASVGAVSRQATATAIGSIRMTTLLSCVLTFTITPHYLLRELICIKSAAVARHAGIMPGARGSAGSL